MTATSSELALYEAAVKANPIRPGEHHYAYIQRIAELTGAKQPAAKTMPVDARLPYRDDQE